jgi:hypothetical protein
VNCELIFCEHHGTFPIRSFMNDEGMSTGFCTVCLKQYIAHLLAVPACEKYMYISFSPHILRIVYEVLLVASNSLGKTFV